MLRWAGGGVRDLEGLGFKRVQNGDGLKALGIRIVLEGFRVQVFVLSECRARIPIPKPLTPKTRLNP